MEDHTDDVIVGMETAALERWCRGDPSGFLEICAPDVVYFDPFVDHRVDGVPALTEYYERLRGTIAAERFEIVNPHVQATGDIAVLTFNFVSHDASSNEHRWNCTEVYRREDAGWRIIHTHWSLTKGG